MTMTHIGEKYVQPQSWTAEGMDWSSPDPENPIYIDALRLAIMERYALSAIGWIAGICKPVLPDMVYDYNYLLLLYKSLISTIPLYINHTPQDFQDGKVKPAYWNGWGVTQTEPAFLTWSVLSILDYLKEDSLLAPAIPGSLMTSTTKSQNSAWLGQSYRIINLLQIPFPHYSSQTGATLLCGKHRAGFMVGQAAGESIAAAETTIDGKLFFEGGWLYPWGEGFGRYARWDIALDLQVERIFDSGIPLLSEAPTDSEGNIIQPDDVVGYQHFYYQKTDDPDNWDESKTDITRGGTISAAAGDYIGVDYYDGYGSIWVTWHQNDYRNDDGVMNRLLTIGGSSLDQRSHYYWATTVGYSDEDASTQLYGHISYRSWHKDSSGNWAHEAGTCYQGSQYRNAYRWVVYFNNYDMALLQMMKTLGIDTNVTFDVWFLPVIYTYGNSTAVTVEGITETLPYDGVAFLNSDSDEVKGAKAMANLHFYRYHMSGDCAVPTCWRTADTGGDAGGFGLKGDLVLPDKLPFNESGMSTLSEGGTSNLTTGVCMTRYPMSWKSILMRDIKFKFRNW